MLKNIYRNLQEHFISIILVLFYFSEAFNKVIKFSTADFFNMSRAVKGIILIPLLIGVLYKNPKSIFHILLLLVCFSLGQFYLVDFVNTPAVILFFKQCFALVIFMYFNIYKLNEVQRNRLFVVFEFLILINSLFIILGFIFSIDIFYTYKGSRFGFNGFFVASATGSFVNIIALFYYVVKLKTELLKDYKAVVLLLAMMLIGTKSVYLTLFLTGVIYAQYYLDFAARKIAIFLFLTILFLFMYFFFYSFGVFNEIRENHGIVSSILSFRNELFLQKTLPFIKEEWGWLNYLFGGLLNTETRSQFGFIDTFYFFGFLGGFYFLFLYYKAFFTFEISKVQLWLVVVLLLIIFLSGNFFANTSLPIYLLVWREAFLKFDKLKS